MMQPIQKLKLLSLACLACLIWFSRVPALALEANRPAALSTSGASRPNIIFIMVDDLGNADLGYRGSDIKTPNIDKLAREGVRLESFHGMPVCTPARAALMTGRYPMRYGLQTLVIFPNHTYGLPTDERTLPQALKEVGYQTSMVGKWHLGHADKKYWPQNRGFDHFYGNLVGEVDYFTKMRGGIVDWQRDGKFLQETTYYLPMLKEGKPSPHDDILVNVEAFRGAIIKGQWKLVKIALLPGKTELFNLKVDPGEQHNVADQNPEVVRDLEARLLAYAQQQKMSEWLKAQPNYLGAQGKTILDPDYDIDDGGLPREKPVFPKL